MHLLGIGFRFELAGHDEFIHVFLPTSPNPTSGYFLLVPRPDAVRLAMKVEDGLKLIVSGGAVISAADGADVHVGLARLRREGTA